MMKNYNKLLLIPRKIIISVLLITLMTIRINAADIELNYIKQALNDPSNEKMVAVEVDLTVGYEEQIFGIQFDISYDSDKMKLAKITCGKAALEAKKELSYANIEDDKGRVLIYGADSSVLESGSLVNLLFVTTESYDLETKVSLASGKVSGKNLKNKLLEQESVDIKASSIYSDLSQIEVYPNPYKPSEGHSVIMFMNLTEDKNIKIYTLTGELVKEIEEIHGNKVEWDVKNNYGKDVASGVYFYLIINDTGEEHRGRLVIIR